jgi:tetratricopeptide (TPR) repeat protein
MADRSPALHGVTLDPAPQAGWLFVMLVVSMLGCGSGPSAEEAQRSMTELRLAATLEEEDAAGNRPAVIEHLLRAVELDRENVRAHLMLGFVLMRGQEWETAERSIREGIRLLEERRDEQALLAEARNMLGLLYIHRERYDDAIPILRQSATELTNRAQHFAWGNLGWAYLEKGEHTRALDALQQAVRIQPRYCVGWYRIGQVHVAQERFEQAEQSLTRALEADERCSRFYQDAWRLRGEVRARLGHREDAVADFERCVELSASSEAGQACRRFLETTH